MAEVVQPIKEKKEKDKDKKKDKKEKKKDKDKDKDKEKKEPSFKQKMASEEYLNREKFKPVKNPDFNPNLVTPFSASLTPSERQGNAAEKYFPKDDYSHLDPAKSNNIYSSFNQLQQKLSNPTNMPQPMNKPQPMHNMSPPPMNKPQPQLNKPQPQLVNRPSQMMNRPPQMIKSPTQPSPNQRPPQSPPGNQRLTHLKDGAKVLLVARASWPYTAQMPSELSFNVNDTFAIIKQQPDGWWYAELLDPKRSIRGLVPGNYMIPC